MLSANVSTPPPLTPLLHQRSQKHKLPLHRTPTLPLSNEKQKPINLPNLRPLPPPRWNYVPNIKSFFYHFKTKRLSK